MDKCVAGKQSLRIFNHGFIMTYDEFNKFCGALACTNHVIQWNNSHVWKVGGKVFAIGGLGAEQQPAFTFKTSEEDFFFLSECEGYRPAPYFASRGMKWIQHIKPGDANDNDLKYYISESHRLIVTSFTKAKKKELGFEI